jgi:hypothetical protein
MSFSALVVFHNEFTAVKECLGSLKKHNGETEIFIARDSLPIDDRTKEIFNEFNPIYLPQQNCMDVIYEFILNKRHPSEMRPEQIKSLLSCNVDRMEKVAKLAKYEYILYLEPDVRVRNKLIPNKKLDMDSLTVNKYTEKFIQLVEKLSGRTLEFDGWGYCTGFATSEGFKKIKKWTLENEKSINELVAQDYRVAYADFIFPILFHMADLKVGESKMVTECNRDFLWRFNGKPIVHQYK